LILKMSFSFIISLLFEGYFTSLNRTFSFCQIRTFSFWYYTKNLTSCLFNVNISFKGKQNIMVEDWELNVRVREVLVKRAVNIKFVNISTNNGSVLVRGVLDFLGEKVSDEHIPQILTRIEKDIKEIKGVRDTKLAFIEWTKALGTWKKLKVAE
ncbi:hypothetical protein KKH65_00020, partial [bacterium]|nr:hypothetical protein [bacterium]